MTPYWLLRLAQWARNPPGPARVRLVLIVIAICALVAGVEYFIGWPESLTVEPASGLRRPSIPVDP